MTAYCKTFFETNLIPSANGAFYLINKVIIMPAKMAITGPPTIGKSFPRKYAGTAMTKERRIPLQFLIIKFIYVPLSLNYSSNFIKLV